MNLNVGKLIYLFKEDSDMLYPCVVVEEVTKKTIDSEIKSYSVMLPDENKTVIPVDNLTLKMFESIDDFVSYARDKNEKRINSISERCQKISANVFSKESKQLSPTAEEENYVILEDGTKAKINFKNNEVLDENTVIPSTAKKTKRSKKSARV